MAARTTLIFLNCCKTVRILNIVRSVHVANFTLFKQNSNKLDYTQSRHLTPYSLNLSLESNNLNYLSCIKRLKHSKKKSQKASEDEDSDEEETDLAPEIQAMVKASKNSKIVTISSTSMRLDTLVKHGMVIARNKVEVAFYESKIRMNGAKVIKKSMQVSIGDEIDLIQGTSPKNPKFLVVTRITILDADLVDDGYTVKILRDKSLTIENYNDPWKPSSGET